MYLDPGFGSMLIQGVVALLACGGVFLFAIRQKIVRLFSKKVTESHTISNSETHNTNDSFEIIEDGKDFKND